MSKIGRNEPCPCDSGKKYKKCCYQTHEEVLGRSPADNKQEKCDREGKSVHDELSDFDSYQDPQTYDEAIEVLETLLKSDTPDPEDVLVTFESLFCLGENKPHFEYYLSMITVLKEKHPAVYQENQKNFLQDSIESLLIIGQYVAVNELLSTFVKCAADDIESISKIASLLIFYDLDEAALTLFRLAWPAIYNSDNVLDWAKDHFKTNYYQLLTIQELVGELNGATIFDAEKFPLIDVKQEEDRSIYTDMRRKLLESSNFEASALLL